MAPLDLHYEKHESARVESQHIGSGTSIGAMARICPGAVLGKRVTIGANATVLSHVRIGDDATVAAGAVAAQNVPCGAVLAGNPARIVAEGPGTNGHTAARLSRAPMATGVAVTDVAGVTLHRMPYILDPRGPLSFGEIGEQVPFEVKRYFLVFDVSSEEIRGEHAHRELHQFLICVHGCCHLIADDGRNRQDFVLDHPSIGVHLPPRVWGVQHKYSHDAVLLVLASAKYDPADYIRSYPEFLDLVKSV